MPGFPLALKHPCKAGEKQRACSLCGPGFSYMVSCSIRPGLFGRGRDVQVVGYVPDDVPGTAFDLIVNFGDVIADDTEAHHQHPADDE